MENKYFLKHMHALAANYKFIESYELINIYSFINIYAVKLKASEKISIILHIFAFCFVSEIEI